MAIFKKEIISNQQFLEMCKVGDTQGVIEAVNSGINIDATRHDSNTVLMWAASEGHTEIVNALIEGGADDSIDKYGKTALIHAASSEHSNPETVNALIDAGSYVKHRNNYGKMALDYARENYNLKRSDTLKRLEELSR